jgi:hypothetical protein
MKAEEFMWNWLEAGIGTIETEGPELYANAG